MIGYIRMFLNNIYRNMKNRKLLCVLLMCQIWLSLFITGTLVEQKNELHDEQQKIEAKSEAVTYYGTGESLADLNYYKYCNDEGKIYGKLLKFHDMLLKEKSFHFQTVSEHPLEIFSCPLPDIFLYGYEEGDSSCSIQEYEGETFYRVKALQVSRDFFDTFQIKIDTGKGFGEKDYKVQETIPVLLGNAYKEYLEIGDTFITSFMCNDTKIQVVGFLEQEAFYYNNLMPNDMSSLERYIVMPAQIPSDDDSSMYNRDLLLQSMYGYIETDLTWDALKEKVDSMLQEVGLDIPVFSVYDPNAMHIDLNKIFEQYAVMTKSVKQQFTIIVFLALIFVLLSMSFTIHGFLRENHYEYGVRLLNGASIKNIAIDIIGLIMIIVLLGDVLAVVSLLMTNRMSSILMVQAVSLLVIVIVSAVSLIHINRMNVSDIISRNPE